MNLMVRWLAGLLAAAGFYATASAAVVIDNNPNGQDISAFGIPNTLTYGQVFEAPVTGTLDSFTLYLNGGVGALFGGVGTWNGMSTFGIGYGSPTNLYQSPNVSSSAAGPYTFNPGISVTAGQLYVAYLSVYDVSEASGLTTMPLGDDSDTYIKYFVWNNSSDPRNNTSWNYFADYGEVQFTATFSSAEVPEPGTLALLGLGLGALGFAWRRKSA